MYFILGMATISLMWRDIDAGKYRPFSSKPIHSVVAIFPLSFFIMKNYCNRSCQITLILKIVLVLVCQCILFLFSRFRVPRNEKLNAVLTRIASSMVWCFSKHLLYFTSNLSHWLRFIEGSFYWKYHELGGL